MKIKGHNEEIAKIFKTFLDNENGFEINKEENAKQLKQALSKYGEPYQLWFRMFSDDTAATDINDIIRNIGLPSSHNNYKYMVESLKLAIENPSGIEFHIDLEYNL